MKEYREYWIEIMKKIVDPVLINLSQGNLKKNMNVAGQEERKKFAYLEALGRTVAGISPWLELTTKDNKLSVSEENNIEKYAKLTREAIKAGTDPNSPDFMIFDDKSGQPLVDAAFLAHGIVRAPIQLWEKYDNKSKNNIIEALKATRKIKPCYSNWLLFSAMIETALCVIGEDFDIVRIDYALKEHENWYMGDGIYGDGPEFHWDYYNSFVIQPMLLDIVNVIAKEDRDLLKYKDILLKRAKRYAEVLERLIAPDGSFPPIGRSLSYRFGVFQLLSQLALAEDLPDSIAPSQVRGALTTVIKKMINMPNTFDNDGWLNIGFCGHQQDIAESYINTGSLYLCSTVFLPLGLSAENEFWIGEDKEWTSKRIWSAENYFADHALDI